MPKRVSGKWYAQAMFELAREKGVLEDCRKGLQKIAELSKDEMLFGLEGEFRILQESNEPLVLTQLGDLLETLLAVFEDALFAGELEHRLGIPFSGDSFRHLPV